MAFSFLLALLSFLNLFHRCQPTPHTAAGYECSNATVRRVFLYLQLAKCTLQCVFRTPPSQKVATAIFVTRLSASHIGTMQALESTDFCQQMVPLYHTTHNNVRHVYWSFEAQRSVYVPPCFSYRLYILEPSAFLCVSLVCHNKQPMFH